MAGCLVDAYRSGRPVGSRRGLGRVFVALADFVLGNISVVEPDLVFALAAAALAVAAATALASARLAPRRAAS